MSFAIGAPVPWTVPPDWTRPVRERLAWMTDVQKSSQLTVRKRALRPDVPRRGFAFEVGAWDVERDLIDACAFDMGGRLWALPIWPDVQVLRQGVGVGSDAIACRTAGFDFAPGGLAMLWLGPRQWELVDVEAVLANGLALADVTAEAWPPGARLYPVRNARLATPPVERRRNDPLPRRESTWQLQFDIDEACTWPAAAWSTMYRGFPVLDAGDDAPIASSEYSRELLVEDGDGTGPTDVVDLAGLSTRLQDLRVVLDGRVEQAQFRGVLYALQGRYRTVWLPSGAPDLQLVTPPAGNTLTMAWAGVRVFGRLQSNRRDICIRLHDGTRLYRRVQSVVEGPSTEVFTVDEAVPAIAPSKVHSISWMSAAQLASDTIEIDHITDADGTARAALRFETVRHDG